MRDSGIRPPKSKGHTGGIVRPKSYKNDYVKLTDMI